MPDPAHPFVSVVIPVRNGADTIGAVLDGLAAQSYPRERFEVIVADNGSSDATSEVARKRGAVLVEETTAFSPAAARNRGIEEGRGDWFAFTDGDCTPDADWLRNLIAAALRDGTDLAGGQVTHRGPGNILVAYEDLTYVRQEERIRNFGVSGAGNLLVRRKVIDAIGPFSPALRYSEDDEFCLRAKAAGFTITFAENAVVNRAAVDSPVALLVRAYRMGRAEAALRRYGAAPVRAAGSTLVSRKRAYIHRVWQAPGLSPAERLGIVLINLAATLFQGLGTVRGRIR